MTPAGIRTKRHKQLCQAGLLGGDFVDRYCSAGGEGRGRTRLATVLQVLKRDIEFSKSKVDGNEDIYSNDALKQEQEHQKYDVQRDDGQEAKYDQFTRHFLRPSTCFKRRCVQLRWIATNPLGLQCLRDRTTTVYVT